MRKFGQVFGIVPQRRAWWRRLVVWFRRFRKPKDPILSALKPKDAPTGMDRYQAAAWASPYCLNLVEAGAGAGKTFLVVERANLLIKLGVEPEKIAFVTFTNAATDELKARLVEKLGHDVASRMVISTIHSFAKLMAKNLGLPTQYALYNKTNPKDPYRLAWRRVMETALAGPDGSNFAMTMQAWLLERDMLREGLPFEHIYPELHGEPNIGTKVGVKVRSKAEKVILERLVDAKFFVKYEWLFLGGKFAFRPDFYLPTSGIFVEYLGLWDHEDPVIRDGYRACFKHKRFEMLRLNLVKSFVAIYPSELRDGSWFRKVVAASSLGEPQKIEKIQREVLDLVRSRLDLVIELAIEVAEHLLRFEDRSGKSVTYNPAVAGLVDLIKRMHVDVINQLMLEEEHEADSYLAALAAYLQGNTERAKIALGNIQYLFVDEFQDVYPSLFSMLLPLFEISKPFVIGDERQSIYGFLGGSPSFIRYLEKWLPGIKRYRLPVNRRSTPNIIRVSESILPPGMLRAEPKKTDDIPVRKVISTDEAIDAMAILSYARSISDDVMVIARVGADTAPEAKAYESACKAVGAKFSTFHGSKGKEADTVIVAGLVSRPRGSWNIPPRAQGHPLIEAIKKRNGGQSIEDEERRLLYVAMSRAKQHMFLVTGVTESAPLAAEPLGRCQEAVIRTQDQH